MFISYDRFIVLFTVPRRKYINLTIERKKKK